MRSQPLFPLYMVLCVYFAWGQEQRSILASSCPLQCVCYRELTTVKCQESSLADLPRIAEDLRGHVEVLDMSGSQIQSLKSFSLSHFPRLKRLILRNNKINEIETTALGNVPLLEDLDLRDNNLKTLPSGVLSNSKLRVLYLEGNPFSCDPSSVSVLLSEIKALMREDTSLEMFDGGLLQCAKPLNMKDQKIVQLLDAHTEESSPIRQDSRPIIIAAVASGIVAVVSLLVATLFVMLKRRQSRKEYYYDFLTSTEEEESDDTKEEHLEESLASRLKKQRRQSQGYPSWDIIDSEEEEAVDQESYIEEKMKAQRRQSMDYALENESDRMEDICLQSPN